MRLKLLYNSKSIKCRWSKAREPVARRAPHPIERVMKTPELTDEQRASILGDNAAKLALRQRDDAGVQ